MRTKGLIYGVLVMLCIGPGWAWGGQEVDTNTYYGLDSGQPAATGLYNSFFGAYAGDTITIGSFNSYFGSYAGQASNGTFSNAFFGYYAGQATTSGSFNAFFGTHAGSVNTMGQANVFVGQEAGGENLTGSYNTYIGFSAGSNNTAGGYNVFLGNYAGYSETGSNRLYIANSDTANPLIYGEFDNNLIKINGTLVIGGSAGAGSPAAGGTVKTASFAGNSTASTFPRESDPKAVRLGSGSVLTVDRVGTLKAGKWCSSPDGVHVTCTQDPPVVGQRDSTPGGALKNGLATSGVRVSLHGTDTGGWLTSVEENGMWLSSGAMYDEGAGRWIQESSDGKAVLVGLGEEGYQVFTLSGNAVGQPIAEREAGLHMDCSGNVGLGVRPEHPLHLAGGAYTDGGSWINGSSREYKEEIETLSTEEALEAIKDLNPVKFAYKADRGERHVGFIAEDVPELVATKDRKGLSPMDIVAVLTKVVQEQQKGMQEQQKIISTLREELNDLKGKVK